MKKVWSIVIGVCLGGMVAAMPLWAQGAEPKKDDKIFTLGEVVVKGSSAVQDITVNNTITAEDIEAIGAINAGEALSSVPGVNMVSTAKGEMNINIRGFGQKDILVLIDGVPYYETKRGPLDLQQIPASIISKIEVSKGASSVLYGPNALGGVVNIVTRKGVDGLAGSVGGELGRGGYYRGAGSLNYGAENGFSLLGSIDYRSRDTLFFSNDYKPRATKIKYKGAPDGRPNPRVVDDGGKKDNSDLESLNLWTRLGYSPSDNFEAYASMYRFNMERGRPFSDEHNKVFNFPNGYSSFGKYDQYIDTGVDLGSRVAVNDWWAFRMMGFYHHHLDDYTSYQSEEMVKKLSTSRWDDDSYGLSLFSDTDLDSFGNLSLTTQYRADKHKQRKSKKSPWEKSASATWTFAVEDTVKFGAFTGVAGLAYHYFDVDKVADLDGYHHGTFDPMVGLTWAAENGLQLFGSIAKKTRFPTFSDMEDSGTVYKLDPEKNITYTLGVRHRLYDMFRVELAGFYNDVTDRIFKSKGNPPANIDKVRMYGIDLETYTDFTDRLGLGLDYVYTNARDKSSNRTSDYLEDVPEHQIISRLEYMIPWIESQFSLRGTYKGGVIFNTQNNRKEDSFVLDTSLTKKWDNGFSLGGYIYNLLDTQYYAGKGMAGNGFDFKLAAQYTF